MKHTHSLWLLTSIGILVGGFFLYTNVDFNPIKMQDALAKDNIVPVAIIGSGPAGLTAALYTARANLPTIVFTGQDVGGQLTEARFVENWPAKRKESGANIIKEMEEQVKHFGARLLFNTVQEIDFSRWPYRIKLDNDDQIHALSMIIATGGAQKTLDIPGVKEYWGKGIGICSICDAPFDKGKTVAILGTTDITADMAMQLKEFADHVYVLVPDERMQAAAVNQKYLKEAENISILYNIRVVNLKGDDKRITHIVIEDTKTGKQQELGVQSFYFAIGFKPNSELFKNQLKMNVDGFLKVNNKHATSKKLVYAAGTIIDPIYQKGLISSAMGAQAAIQLIEDLQNSGFTDKIEEDLKPNFYKKEQEAEAVIKLNSVDELRLSLKYNGIVIAEFYGQNCPACKMVSPVLQAIAKEYKDKAKFVKIDIQDMPELIDEFQLSRIPTFCIFFDGKQVACQDAIISKDDLQNFIQTVIQSKETD